ncbi:MAG TPA: histidine kinase dimerization/phosphoacceptor domain -containing protein [Spirochaetia bacterium]|nr:histidine kinase dimerization/phosphoacceptor domain -containing protein [Spirochaetia bacterium]
MGSGPRRSFFATIASAPVRIINFYVGPVEKNSMEYWQRFTFYVIALAGIVAGTICIIPACIWIFSTGRPLATVFIVEYVVDVWVILSSRFSVKTKTMVIAVTFWLLGVTSLVLAGPEGESGIWFSVCVLITSLFIGFRASLVMGAIDFLTGMTFAVLHSLGLIGWDVLRNFHFFSWVIQCTNIFLIDITFAVANAMLIRGVDSSFKSLAAAEATVRGNLMEKETLIRELYHRSKNNMQVVSSLLMLHSKELKEPGAKVVFKDVINKIGSMSLVHQKLYESHDLSNIDMADYVRDLVVLLMKGYGVPTAKVDLTVDITDVSLLIDTAIPCGLIISEIVSNSLKHAFPGDRRGRIGITMSRAEGDFVDLRISDDGVGVPEGFVASSDGKMGMQTVFTIVTHQMQGEITFSSNAGVEYLIRFKRRLYEERVRSHG